MEWPWQYTFPPFFTIQPNSETREKQLEAWKSLVLAYAKLHRIESLVVSEALTSDLFSNTAIKRSLDKEGATLVLDQLAASGHVEWEDATKAKCLVMWRSPQEWGDIIYRWVDATGQQQSVCTLYELNEGTDTKDQDFHGLGVPLLTKALDALQVKGRAALMQIEEDSAGFDGVKFL